MIALKVDKYYKIKGSGFKHFWETFTLNGDFYFLEEAQSDLDKHGINYIIGEVEIKPSEDTI